MDRAFISFCTILASFLGFALGGNINLDATCPINNGCLQCMSRGSADIERCQQLYFYVTNTTANNQAEIDRYCSGDCPIILATANFYCSGSNNFNDLLTTCPSYSIIPTGSFSVNPNVTGSHCLNTQQRCFQCIGEDNQEATRCLQLYLLATSPNTTSTYASRYCNSNCPLTVNSYGRLCDGSLADTLLYCERNDGNDFCGELAYQAGSQLDEAAQQCQTDCTSFACTSAIQQYGCCLRRIIGNTCSNIPTCTLATQSNRADFNIDSSCPITECSPCLSRNSDSLERCEQLYSYLSAAVDPESSQATVLSDFCSGECPVLLLSSDLLCNRPDRSSTLWNFCPMYDYIPSASTEIQARYGSNDLQICPVSGTSQLCYDCIGSRSSEPVRCYQLYRLTEHPNVTNFYTERFCSSNCPLTLGTTNWYCTGEDVTAYFQRCWRISQSNEYCSTLRANNQDDYSNAISSCQQNCTTTECVAAINRYECCLNENAQIASTCNIPSCNVQTAGARHLSAMPLAVTILSVLLCYLAN